MIAKINFFIRSIINGIRGIAAEVFLIAIFIIAALAVSVFWWSLSR